MGPVRLEQSDSAGQRTLLAPFVSSRLAESSAFRLVDMGRSFLADGSGHQREKGSMGMVWWAPLQKHYEQEEGLRDDLL